jgi:TatD DNase family protein
MFDSHCHPQFSQYDSDREEMIKRALSAGCGMVCVGTDLEDSKRAIELAEKHSNMWASVGCHPNDDSIKGRVLGIKGYEELAENPKVVAIGEVGLDYYRTTDKENKEKQKEALTEFIDLGIKINKPLIFHVRDPLRWAEGEPSAYEDVLETLNTHPLILNTKISGVIHSFTGDFNLARKFLDLGLYLGLNGIITFPSSSRQGGTTEGQAPVDLREMITNLPLDKILIETDAPYLAPVPYRGKRNEPLLVEFVAKKIAELKNISVEEVIKVTDGNTKKLFRLETD